MDEVYVTRSGKETIELGRKLGRRLRPGDIVKLEGDIGAGKTTFVKGVALGLGLRKTGDVKSPTFVIMHIYPAKTPLYHFDLYRLEELNELPAIGFEEFVSDPSAVKCVEWAERAEGLFPAGSLTVTFEITGKNKRSIRFSRGRGTKTRAAGK